MGEYALYKGERIKIGTCEQMYYLRADQVHLVEPVSGSVNPRNPEQAGAIRFRFPFPQEDGIEPGAFEDHDYGLGISGVEPPEDIKHHDLQFVRSYPRSGGILLCVPCPRSTEGLASKIEVTYNDNGYSGAVHIHSQRLMDGQLRLVLRCGDCGALYRVDSLADATPVLESLEKQAKHHDRHAMSDIQQLSQAGLSQGSYYREVSRRIVAGYTEPNFWSTQPALATGEAA